MPSQGRKQRNKKAKCMVCWVMIRLRRKTEQGKGTESAGGGGERGGDGTVERVARKSSTRRQHRKKGLKEERE